MAQARRRTPAKKKAARSKSKPPRQPGQALFGAGMLVAGIVIGSLATVLWQGTRSADKGVGAGIRQMMETSQQEAEQAPTPSTPAPSESPEKPSTSYDFYTVLPEIEVVVTSAEPEPEPKVKSEPVKKESPDADEKPAKEPETPAPKSSYMLQAGSFKNESDADRQKASLALMGMVSTIQKITIQGQGDFYRVRLGPFNSHDEMVRADRRLSEAGIKALRLKISRAG